MKIKSILLSLMLGSSVTLVSASDFLGFTPSSDFRCAGHSVFWGPDTNTVAWPMDVGYAGDTDSRATNFNLSLSSNPPHQGQWISVRAWGYDGTNKIYSVLAPPVYYDTNLLAGPITATNGPTPATPLTPPSNTVIYRQ